MQTLIALALLFLAVPAVAENKFNIMTGEYEVVPPGYELQFNKMNGEWSYVPPGAQLELNRSTLNFEFPGSAPTGSRDPVPLEYRLWQRNNHVDPLLIPAPTYHRSEIDRNATYQMLRDTDREVQSIIERQYSGQSAPAYRPRERDDSGQRQLEETRRAVQEFHEQHSLPLKDRKR